MNMTGHTGMMQGAPSLPAGAGNTPPAAAAADSDEAHPLELGSLTVLPRWGCVKGYSRAVVRVSFTPPAAGPVRDHIRIHFRYLRLCLIS